MDYRHVMETDPELFKAIADEVERQREHIELIASENFVSPAVMEAMGSPLTNKYAEGYPAKRYYGGCQYVTAPSCSLGPSTPTCSPTAARRPIPPSTLPCSIPAIRCWA